MDKMFKQKINNERLIKINNLNNTLLKGHELKNDLEVVEPYFLSGHFKFDLVAILPVIDNSKLNYYSIKSDDKRISIVYLTEDSKFIKYDYGNHKFFDEYSVSLRFVGCDDESIVKCFKNKQDAFNFLNLIDNLDDVFDIHNKFLKENKKRISKDVFDKYSLEDISENLYFIFN